MSQALPYAVSAPSQSPTSMQFHLLGLHDSRADRFPIPRRSSVFSTILTQGARFALPAVGGPASALLLPLAVYVVMRRKLNVQVSLS